MPPDVPTVRHATVADLPGLQRTLGRAFEHDPVWSWAIKKRTRMDERIGVFLGVATQLHLEHDSVWMTGDGRSAAVWAPPKLWRIPPRKFLPFVPRTVRAAGVRSFVSLAAMAETERRHPRGAHWYLAILGTDPDAQGRGLASAVMAPALARCDADGLGAYLESSNEENIPFYARHGFEVTGTIDLRHSGPRVWTMWREPPPPEG